MLISLHVDDDFKDMISLVNPAIFLQIFLKVIYSTPKLLFLFALSIFYFTESLFLRVFNF